jgi:glycosyltransferase involved in cell wall biosynthesis
MLGALPPWRGVAPYTRHLLEGLEGVEGLDIEFIDFTSLYPQRLYPGGEPRDRNGTRPHFRKARVRGLLAWYNPLTWAWAGLTLRGRVVHAQWWSYILAPVYLVALALARLRGRRVVLTVHNVQLHEESRWKRWLYESVFRLANHFILHSQRNAEALAELYPSSAGRVTVVPHGLLTAGAARGPSRLEARRELDLPANGPVILAFGNIRAYKGLDVLLRALGRMLEEGQEPTLAIAGQPWGDFGPYQRIIDELGLDGHVRTWLGYVPDEAIPTFFAAADLAAFPYTHFDAQSGAAALALWFRLPMVVSDVGGLPDVVADPRSVVPPNDSIALARVMSTILADDALRAKLAADARQRALEFDWGVIARKTADVYSGLMREVDSRIPLLRTADPVDRSLRPAADRPRTIRDLPISENGEAEDEEGLEERAA